MHAIGQKVLIMSIDLVNDSFAFRQSLSRVDHTQSRSYKILSTMSRKTQGSVFERSRRSIYIHEYGHSLRFQIRTVASLEDTEIKDTF